MPATIVTISNVPPFTANEGIKKELAQFVSVVTMISLSFKKPTLKHVMSFRRQVFMFLIWPTITLDALFCLEHGESLFMVFATTENLK